MIREWRINRVRERIARNKSKLQTMVSLDASYYANNLVDTSGLIARDQQFLARLQGFAQNHDAELRQPVKITKKETP